jgi:hypothetical protein
MNEPRPDAGLDALFAQARAHRPDTSAVEYAFETRLLARLRSGRPPDSIWATVSWRLIPFFATCLVVLTLWQSQVISETDEAEQVACVTNPDALESWNNLN